MVMDERGRLRGLLDRLGENALARTVALAAVAALAGAVALGAFAAGEEQETLLRRDAGSAGVATIERSADSSGGDGERAVIEQRSGDEDVSGGSGSDASDEQELLYVDVGGAVREPGLKRLTEGARVNDAIDAAGGLTEDADERQVNRAALVADGEKIYIPELGESADVSSEGGSAGGDLPAESSDVININTADAQLLDELPGVGPATAQAIIEDREANGPFSVPEDIMRVTGIGEKKFEKMKDALCV